MKKLFVWIAVTAAFALSAAPKVLVYMLDGARADVLEATGAPAWKALKENRWAEGYHTAWSVTAGNEPYVLPASAPNHAVIATGKLAKHHQVLNNRDEYSNKFSQSATPTWQERIGRKFPDLRIVYAYSWRPDVMLVPESGRCTVVCGDDDRNNLVLTELLKRKNSPSVLMVFDDGPDHGGHKSGFYPYSKEYLQTVNAAMGRFGKLLDAIKAQPTFADDDWLIVLCSDHGGQRTGHGFPGGQCNTVPLLYCGKNVAPGQIAGRPNNLGIAANVLRHFGLESEVAELDDPGNLVIAPAVETPLADGMLYDLAVESGKFVNRAAGGGVTPHGSLEVGATSFRTGRNGYLTLDGLKNFSGDAVTFAITLKCDLSQVKSDPPVFGNKDWQTGANPGILLAAHKNYLAFNAACTDAPLDFLVRSPRRIDLTEIITGKGKNLIAVSIRPDGLVTVYQKGADGREYWFCVKGTGMRIATGLDWNIGQDGKGKYAHHVDFEASRFRFWQRALTLDELRKVPLE